MEDESQVTSTPLRYIKMFSSFPPYQFATLMLVFILLSCRVIMESGCEFLLVVGDNMFAFIHVQVTPASVAKKKPLSQEKESPDVSQESVLQG